MTSRESPDELAARMRAMEYFHGLRLLPGAWAVVRVDGRSFSKLTEERYQKPFDPAFHGHMVAAARALLEDLQGRFAYTESDEVSVLLAPDWDQFDREVEKLVSLSAGLASATFSHAAGAPVVFDGRVWMAAREDDVLDYFRWRAADAARCALSTACYWTLRNAGRTAREATRALEGATVAQKHALLFQHGMNFNELPPWQRRGVGLVWESYEKPGVDPRTGATVTATRRRIAVVEDLPLGGAWDAFIRALASPPSASPAPAPTG